MKKVKLMNNPDVIYTQEHNHEWTLRLDCTLSELLEQYSVPLSFAFGGIPKFLAKLRKQKRVVYIDDTLNVQLIIEVV